MAVSTGKREWRQLDQVRSKTCSLDCGRTGFKLRQQGPIPKMTLTQVGSQKVINFNHWGNDYRQVYFIHFKIKLKCSGCSVLVTQSCQTLCDPMDCSLPGSPVHWILLARILELVAIPSSRRSSQLRDQTWVSCILLHCRQEIIYH